MSKKLLLSAALALALTGGTVAGATLPAAAPVAVAQALPAAAPLATAPVAAQAAVPLSTMEMSVVQGAGIFSFFRDAWKAVRTFVAGVLKRFLNSLINSWIDRIFGLADGGAKQNRTQEVTENYNTQADYDAGIVSSTSTVENDWVTTETWSGGGGGCGGSGGVEGGGLYYDREVMDTTC